MLLEMHVVQNVKRHTGIACHVMESNKKKYQFIYAVCTGVSLEAINRICIL